MTMLEEKATVVEKDEDYAWVQTQPQSSCKSCGSSGSCGTSVLSGLFKPKQNLLRIDNTLDLQVGEQVVLGLEAGQLVKAAFYAYLLPLILMVMMSMMASDEGFADLAVLGIALCSLVAGLTLARMTAPATRVAVLGRVGALRQEKIQFINMQGKDL